MKVNFRNIASTNATPLFGGGVLGAVMSLPAMAALIGQGIAPGVWMAVVLGTGVLAGGAGAVHNRKYLSGASAKTTPPLTAAKPSGHAEFQSQTELLLQLNENGDVVNVSKTADKPLSEVAQNLIGKGLYRHLRVSDRPAFLKSVSDVSRSVICDEMQVEISANGTGLNSLPCALVIHQHGDGLQASLRQTQATRPDLSEQALMERAANVAHEFRSPLNGILGFSELMARSGPDAMTPDQMREYAGYIHDAGQHLLRITDSTLDFSERDERNTHVTLEEVSAADLLAECRNLLQFTLERRSVDLAIELDDPDLHFAADRQGLLQCLVNLVDNAVKYSDPSGNVAIEVKKSDGHVHLAVRDQGVGIPDAALPQLGQPFVRVDGQSQSGTGLGLSLVRRFAALHGGALELESLLGEGTTARLVLPCVGLPAGAKRAGGPHSRQTIEQPIVENYEGRRRNRSGDQKQTDDQDSSRRVA